MVTFAEDSTVDLGNVCFDAGGLVCWSVDGNDGLGSTRDVDSYLSLRSSGTWFGYRNERSTETLWWNCWRSCRRSLVSWISR